MKTNWRLKLQGILTHHGNIVLIPTLLVVAGFLIGGVLFVKNRQAQIEVINRLVEAQAQATTSLVKHRLEERFGAMDRMASRHTGTTSTMEDQWKRDAENYSVAFQGFKL